MPVRDTRAPSNKDPKRPRYVVDAAESKVEHAAKEHALVSNRQKVTKNRIYIPVQGCASANFPAGCISRVA